MGGRKERRASVVIRETAQQLAGLHADADRSNALMAELEALLSASQVASGSTHCPGSVFASANFTAAQPLEVSTEDDEHEEVEDCDEEGVNAEVENISNRRLKTMLTVGRTASVITVGSGSNGPLLITGTSASFSARPAFAPPTLYPAPAPAAGGSPTGADGGGGRRSLSFCNLRIGGSSSVPRSGSSATNGGNPPKPVNSSAPHSAAAHPRCSTNGGGGWLASEPSSSSAGQPSLSGERRPAFIAWIASRSPTRRGSRTAEAPGPLSPQRSPPSAYRRSSQGELPPPTTAAASSVSASPTPRSLPRRASSTSHGNFLPRLGRRDSDASGSPLYGIGSGGGSRSTSTNGGEGAGVVGNGGNGGGAAPPLASAPSNGNGVGRWMGLLGGAKSARFIR